MICGEFVPALSSDDTFSRPLCSVSSWQTACLWTPTPLLNTQVINDPPAVSVLRAGDWCWHVWLSGGSVSSCLMELPRQQRHFHVQPLKTIPVYHHNSRRSQGMSENVVVLLSFLQQKIKTRFLHKVLPFFYAPSVSVLHKVLLHHLVSNHDYITILPLWHPKNEPTTHFSI